MKIASLLIVTFTSAILHAAPPRVVSSTVENGQDDVDPAMTEIRVEFDQPMSPNSWSLVGAGDEIVDKPRYADERTLVIPVKLQPDHEYWMSLNSDTFKGFQGKNGEAALPQPMAYKTRAAVPATAPANPLTVDQNREAIVALRKAIDEDYSYRDRLKLDWDKLFAEQKPAMESAKTANQFARAAVRILRNADDAHVFVKAGDRTLSTNANPHPPNYNVQTLSKVIPQWKEHDGGVVSGKLAGNVGYLLIPEWSESITKGLDDAFAVTKNTNGLIIDVRMNGGGDEVAAQKFAGRFLSEAKVYSKNRIRSNGKWDGPFDRVVEPRAESDRYNGPIAVLIGPKVASSCESFVLMMKQSPKCKLVGEATKGSSGRPQPHELGNGVTVFLPSWEDQTPDGAMIEGKGVPPDSAVTPISFKRSDPILDAALDIVRKP